MASKDIMIDIETLSIDSDALVLSVGAIAFDCTFENGPRIDEASAFLSMPSIVEQLLLGRSVSRGTQEFWRKQPAASSDHWTNPTITRVKVGEMLEQLAQFVADVPRVWANGAVFDFGILESLYKQFNMPVPWKYNAVRDARTFYDTNPEIRTCDFSKEDCIAHHPLGDCRSQIIRMWEHGYGIDPGCVEELLRKMTKSK